MVWIAEVTGYDGYNEAILAFDDPQKAADIKHYRPHLEVYPYTSIEWKVPLKYDEVSYSYSGAITRTDTFNGRTSVYPPFEVIVFKLEVI